jgi:NAD(P) transhydrogenase subunit alpha
MQIAVPKEIHPGEKRVALIPKMAERLVQKGATLFVESGLGLTCHYTDEQYIKAGAKIEKDRKTLLSSADMILRLRKPASDEVMLLKKGAVHVSYFDPFNETALMEDFMKAGVSAISIEMIPRTTKAQKMDALSSQASLGGYVAVILAAERMNKIFPMMMTPAGTLSPARVFIVGAGVAGLQAIATAKRLGARVEAFDTRPVVEEQVKSLGAKFVKIDLGETGQTQGGYAKQLTPEQLEKQRQGMMKICAASDVIITTAQVFGRKAPCIISKEMLSSMKAGSVVVDMAVETGGNVEGSVLDQEVLTDNGVLLIGLGNLPGHVAVNASEMLASNLFSFVDEFWDKDTLTLNLADPIIQGCLITHQGQIVHPTFKK